MYNVTQEVENLFNETGSIKRGYLQIVPLSNEEPTILNEDDIKSFTILDDIYTPNYGIIGSIISKQLTFDLFKPLNADLIDREIDVYVGVENSEGEATYVPYGRYIIQKPETNDTTNQVISEAFDYMIKFNKEYKNTITDYENCTVLDIFNSICEQCGVVAGVTEFTNSSFKVTENVFTNSETCREVLTAIAQISGCYARIGRDNKIYLSSLEVQNDTTVASSEFDDDQYDKLELNQVYGGINRLVIKLGGGVEGENVTREDTTAQEQDGLYELDIIDNPFLYTEALRELAIDAIWDKVKGLKYYDFTMTGISKPYLDCGDTIKINNTLTILLTHEIKFTGALKSSYSAIADTLSQTQYIFTPEMKTALKRTELTVKKQAGEIEGIISEQTDLTTNVTQIIANIEGINSSVTSLDNNFEELKSQVTQTTEKLELSISRSNGNNLVKNSDMSNGTEFWQAHLKAAYSESDTPPENPNEDDYWYCTSSYDIYEANQMYKYVSNVWQKSDVTRKFLSNVLGLLHYTTNYENDESKLNTASGRYIRVDVDKEYPEATHSFNATNLIAIDSNEEYITISLKIKNNIKLGNVMIALGFIPNFDLPAVENPEFMYEPSILLTPDDYSNTLKQYTMTIKMPKKSDYISVVTGVTPPTDTTKYWLYELRSGIGVVMQFDGTNWVQLSTTAIVYEEATKIIWSYRGLYGAYYKTNFTSDLEIKSIIPVVAFYGGFALTSSTTSPTPQKGLYWLDTASNKCFRAKYNEEEFVEWEDTGLTATWVSQNIMPVANVPFVPPKGYFEFSDLKVEWNSIATRWNRYQGEIYSKNFKADENGLTISSGKNTMFIDEDEILATYNNINIFGINGDLCFTRRFKAEQEIALGEYKWYLAQVGNDTQMLLN